MLLQVPIPYRDRFVLTVLRVQQRVRAAMDRSEMDGSVSDLPIPPAKLRILVTGDTDVDWFLRSGKAHAFLVGGLLERNHAPLDDMDAMLDFGCGCGRIARWWASDSDPHIHGCDVNAVLVDWCSQNLPFMTARTTDLEPPLPYEAEAFDLVHSYSVFTHLAPELQERWLAELRRVLRPGGLLLITLQGDAWASKIRPADRAAYDRGEPVTEYGAVEGSELCLAYHPPSWVREHLLADFEFLEHVPGVEESIPPLNGVGESINVLMQDRYLARRPPDTL